MALYTARRKDADPQALPRLIDAASKPAARSILAKEWEIELAAPAELLELGKAGVQVETGASE